MDEDIKKLMICIPVPNYVPKGSGIHATTNKDAVVRTRIPLLERELIKEMADKCGIKLSTFIRHCAVECALKLKEREETDA